MPDGQFKAIEYIESCANKADSEIDAGMLALAMVYDDHSGLSLASLERYIHHFKSIAGNVQKSYRRFIGAGSADDVGVRLAALKSVIADEHGYVSGNPHYEILESADMIRVIDLGKGCPEALGLLYIDAARKCGWQIEGLDVASHFLCRLEISGERQIFNPSQGCKIMRAHDLRALVKNRLGEDAELLSKYLEGMDIGQCIIHLCNRLKLRRIEMGEYTKALEMVERMRVLMPEEYRLLLDAGVLYARTSLKDKARACLGDYIEKAPNSYDRFEAKAFLDELD
ncbi:MAG: hypothetical protein KAJ29_07785 [Alphaproteobacteria bacterium]|nr:hypothetical protein [Alphaproteobacteria bacterium]